MSLLDLIKEAAAAADSETSVESKYPIVLNAIPILSDLKAAKDDTDDIKLIKRVEGWKVSETDTEIIESGNKFTKRLKKKLKNRKSFNTDEFLEILHSFLKKIVDLVNLSDDDLSSSVCLMLEKSGVFIGKNLLSLILEASLKLEVWDVLKTLIIQGVTCVDLVEILVRKQRSDLLCLCVKHVSDIQSDDFVSIFKYFLTLPKVSKKNMVGVKEDWENQASLAIESCSSRKNDKSLLAKEASLLLWVAYDGFTPAELCLHYLFASSNLDSLTLSYVLSRLNGTEMLSLIKYLGKWLKKYEKFPQANPCPKAGKKLGLKACDWVPSLKSIVKYLGLVLDEHFSKLVLYTEFQEELRLINGVVQSLASEARLCCSVADVVENLKLETQSQRDA
ncbi:uncharacterized protein LOC113331626 [Papaver somniferum]|uniref:uncharacterized protein LOC113331626 n=1 Tax=Papaver somniferum TaxID=3469 RepID=UPI000E6FCB3F|nr:uncharacterized protein LOC113331626 [Papaver somniferum]XP_026434104.1 uncharacterized protein LOC113331626 [Papaver somniferum]